MTKQELRDAKALISDPVRWTKGAFARNVRWHNIHDPMLPLVARWCVLGACWRAMGRRPDVWESTELRAVAIKLYSGVFRDPIDAITRYNDLETTTHADIMDLFDRAIELAPEG